MVTPRFDLGAYSLVFTNGIQLPSSEPINKSQAIDRTAGGTLRREDLGVTWRRRELNFRGITKAKYIELETWFDIRADGAKNSFTYTDETGATMTVVIVSPTLDFKETRNGFLDGDLVLEVIS